MPAWIPDVIAAALVVGLIVSLAIVWLARRRSDARLRQIGYASVRWCLWGFAAAFVAIIVGIISLAIQVCC